MIHVRKGNVKNLSSSKAHTRGCSCPEGQTRKCSLSVNVSGAKRRRSNLSTAQSLTRASVLQAQKRMPSARIELAILSFASQVSLKELVTSDTLYH
jgi:hypothetical protein